MKLIILTRTQYSIPLLLVFLSLSLQATKIFAVEQTLSGLLDLRITTTDSSESYLRGGYGKFRYSDGEKLSLAQLALNYRLEWENNISFHLVTNAYGDDENNGIGVTESYFKYRSFPSENGIRYQARAGFMYPNISLENNATGWSSPYTLTYSTMNTWIGEEMRHVGLEASITKMGKFSDSSNDFTASAVLFGNNDPNGSLLAWHGWTQSSRQSFWNEMLDFPDFPALDNMLATQARRSDPFNEVDGISGYQISGQWDLRGKARVLAGYYDNRGGVDGVEDGQYVWQTSFSHIAVKWIFDKHLTLIFQQMSGNTKMRVVDNFDVVSVDFSNVFLLLSKRWDKIRLSGRAEIFDTDDLDNIYGDDNNEKGKALTLSLAYQIKKQIFIHLEANWIDSKRPSRYYLQLNEDTTERQLQLALRYFF